MIERRATFRVGEGNLAEALAAIEEFVSEIARTEPDTVVYHSYQEVEDPTRFFHLMRFTDAAARDHHVGTDHVRRFVDRLYPLCDEEPTFVDVRTVAAR